ncbi:MAG: hypothetical protein E6L09_14395, partial [Verrucomicrobia bacterium]
SSLSVGDHAVEVAVHGACGPTVTNVATLTVQLATAADGPVDLTRDPGQSANFSSSASGAEPMAYQWRKNGVDIADATGPTYRIDSVSGSDAGTYSVVVSGPCASVTNSATWTVNACMPVGSAVPQLNRQTGLFEQKVSFTNSTESTLTAVRFTMRRATRTVSPSFNTMNPLRPVKLRS